MLTRRFFLQTTTAGLVATATMAQAGALAEFLDLLRRRPSYSFPDSLAPGAIDPDRTVFLVTEVIEGFPVAMKMVPHVLVAMADPRETALSLQDPGVNGIPVKSIAPCPTLRSELSLSPVVRIAPTHSLKVGDLVTFDDLARVPLRNSGSRINERMLGASGRIQRGEPS